MCSLLRNFRMAAFAAVVVVICASSAGIYDRPSVIEWARDMRLQATDVLETLQSAMDAMVDQETGVRGYLLSGDETFLAFYHRGGDTYTAAIQKLKVLIAHDPAQQRRFDELRGERNFWMQRREAKNRPERPQGSPETERAERYPRKSSQKRPVLSRPGNLQFGGTANLGPAD
jgi:hypothetical protein